MIYPHTVQLGWGGSIDLEPRDLPDWAAGQVLTWTITSGQGILFPIGEDRQRFTAPKAAPGVPTQTVIILYAGDEPVGEAVINMAAYEVPQYRKPPEEITPEPEPEPPPTEEEIADPLDCCVDPHNPDQPIQIIPTSVTIGPYERVGIRIPFIYQDCDEGCYTWKISRGGGILECSCGAKAIYRAPKSNRDREKNALVRLFCDKKPVAECKIAINSYWATEHAYAEYDDGPTWTSDGPILKPMGDPPAIPATMGNQKYLNLVYNMQLYNCMSEMVLERPYHQFRFQWGYSVMGEKWVLQDISPFDVFGSYDAIGDIPLKKLHIPRAQDLRTTWMKSRGCCPDVAYEKLIMEILEESA